MDTSGSLEKLVERVKDKARDEAEAIVERANKVAERDLENAAAEQRRRKEEADKREGERIEAMLNAAQADIALRERKALLKRQKEAVDAIFTEALEQLRTTPLGEDRKALLTRLAAECVQALGSSEVSLALNYSDRQLVSGSDFSVLDAEVTIEEESIDSAGGVVASTDGGRLTYENTFEAIIEGDRARLRSLAAKTLELDKDKV